MFYDIKKRPAIKQNAERKNSIRDFCISGKVHLMMKNVNQSEAPGFQKWILNSVQFFRLQDESQIRIYSTENEYARHNAFLLQQTGKRIHPLQETCALYAGRFQYVYLASGIQLSYLLPFRSA